VSAARRPSLRLALACAVAFAAGAARGYETDQYSHRLQPLADSAPVLDAVVDRALARIAAGWHRTDDRERFAFEVYQDLGGVYWVDHIERFAMRSPEIDRLPRGGRHGIYAGAPVRASRVEAAFGIGATIRLAGALVGTDKLGHFFSQGFKYYKSYLAGWSEARILARGRFNERWIFGQLTTSVYSNADLVADYQGYRFYRSLFEDDVVAGKPAIVRLEGGVAHVQRQFHWSDYVDDYWDEALDPSHMSPAMERFIRRRLRTLCGEYARDPAAYVPSEDKQLERHYRELELRPAPELRMDNVCGQATAAGAAADEKPGR
jgi:hypothetical protein